MARTTKPQKPTKSSHDPQQDDSSRLIKIQQDEDTTMPVPQIALSAMRFFLTVIIGVAVTAGSLVLVRGGITIQHDVVDPLGSSENADDLVELYQTLSGYVTAAFGLFLEEYFKIFIAVMVTYFANAKWYPGDDPREGTGRFKATALFMFTPMVMYVINIGISSVFIEHSVSGVQRAFVDADLVLTSSFSVQQQADSADGPNSVMNTVLRTAVTNNVVPYAIRADSKCASRDLTKLSSNSSEREKTRSDIPSITYVQSTSVAYGFPRHEWLRDAMPHELTPTQSVELAFGDKSSAAVAAREAQFQAFQSDAGVTYETLFDLLVQGFTLHDKSASQANAFLHYPCAFVDGLEDLPNPNTTPQPETEEEEEEPITPSTGSESSNSTRRLQDDSGSDMDDTEEDDDETTERKGKFAAYGDDSIYEGKRKCLGHGSILPALQRVAASKTKTVQKIVDELTATVDDPQAASSLGKTPQTDGSIRPDKMNLKLETFSITPQMKLVTMTLDMPYAPFVEYQQIDYTLCTKDGKFKDQETNKEEFPDPAEFAYQQRYACDPSFYVYTYPEDLCGARSCVFKDASRVKAIKKQLLAMPHMNGCNPGKITYNHDAYSWLPSGCTPEENALFLYGHGTYVRGTFIRDEKTGIYVRDAIRHHVVTFARIEWQFEDLTSRFGATCKIPGECDGVIHPLVNSNGTREDNKARVLLAGAQHMPQYHVNRTLLDPLPLVSLNTPKFYYNGDDDERYYYYVWEHLDMSLLNTAYREDDGLGLDKGKCSVVLDAYLDQVKANHYILQQPLQPLYTAAVFYLFQNATVKEVTLPKDNTLGVVDLSQPVIGKARMKADREVKEIRYSIPIVSAISTCVGVVVMFIYLAIVLKWPRDPVKLIDETNPAAMYADVLTDDLYPKSVHARRLQLPDGEMVPMDDYKVDSITFSHPLEPDLKFVMQ